MEGQPDKPSSYVLALVGAREMNNYEVFCTHVDQTIASLWEGHNPIKVVSGGAAGADTMARKWAKERDIPIVEYKPDWKKRGRAAGLERNTDIIEACDRVIAFPSAKRAPGKGGTQDSIRKAKARKKECVVIDEWE